MSVCEERASILRGEGAMIFNMVCDRATPTQWAEWLRVPLEHAAGTGNADLVDKLLKAGADGSAGWEGCDGKTLLHAAAEGGSEQAISALMRAGADQDMETEVQPKWQTPLHRAALGGKVDTAKALILAGANVEALDDDRDSPLHLAIKGGHAGLAGDLLLGGAFPNIEDSDGHLPMQLAASRGQDAVVRSLLLKRVEVDCCSFRSPRTPLLLAVGYGHLSTVNLLLAAGADETLSYLIHTPLSVATEHDNADIIAAIAKAGGDVNVGNDSGVVPLAFAAYHGSCSAMHALLRLGACVHLTKPDTGCTPLHFACQRGNAGAADLLLRWGADETDEDYFGRTPSDCIPDIAEAPERDRPRLERLSKFLSSAPQDRAWRRRGMLACCRAHPDRVRLGVEIPDTAEAIGQPQGRPSRRARRGQVELDVPIGGAQNDGELWSGNSARAGTRAAREGSSGCGGCDGGFDGVAAWLMALTDDEVFRNIVGFL